MEHETVSKSSLGMYLLKWFLSVFTLIALVVVGIGIWEQRTYIPIIGTIWLVSLGIVPSLLLIWGIVWLIRYIVKSDVIHIGTTGTVLKSLVGSTTYYPLGLQEHRGVGTTRVTEENNKIEVPELLPLLKEGKVGGSELLLGFHIDGSPRYDIWESVRTFIVGGKSRSGKTVTMVFFILQALLSGASIYICDLHYRKKDGLLKVLEALTPYMHVARTCEEIVEVTRAFSDEMHEREAGKDCTIPCLYIVDEWTYTLRQLETEGIALVVDTYLNCAEAYAAFNGFAMIAGHEWTARESGGKKGTALRRNTASVFVHKIDEDYAKFLLQGSKGKKLARLAPELVRGSLYFQDSEGTLDTLYIPYYGKNKEAILEVANILAQGVTVEGSLQIGGSVNGLLEEGHNEHETPVNRSVNDMETEKLGTVNVVETEGNTGETDVNGFHIPTETDGIGVLKGYIRDRYNLGGSENTLRRIAQDVKLSGRNYDRFKAICEEVGIVTERSKVIS